MKYAAFISYRHGGIDEKVGMQIQHDLERYKIPSKIAKSIGKKVLAKSFVTQMICVQPVIYRQSYVPELMNRNI